MKPPTFGGGLEIFTLEVVVLRVSVMLDL